MIIKQSAAILSIYCWALTPQCTQNQVRSIQVIHGRGWVPFPSLPRPIGMLCSMYCISCQKHRIIFKVLLMRSSSSLGFLSACEGLQNEEEINQYSFALGCLRRFKAGDLKSLYRLGFEKQGSSWLFKKVGLQFAKDNQVIKCLFFLPVLSIPRAWTWDILDFSLTPTIIYLDQIGPVQELLSTLSRE